MCKQQVLEALGDWVSEIYRVVAEAIKMDSAYRKQADIWTSRTTSSARNDHMVAIARRNLTEPTFHHLKRGQRNLFDFEGQFLIHFKKLSRSFHPFNYPTQLALQLFDTGTAEGLPGIPPHLPTIYAGYMVPSSGVGVDGIYLAHLKGGVPVWSHRLDDDASADSQPTIIPIAPYDPASPTSGTRIRAKDGSTRKSRPGSDERAG